MRNNNKIHIWSVTGSFVGHMGNLQLAMLLGVHLLQHRNLRAQPIFRNIKNIHQLKHSCIHINFTLLPWLSDAFRYIWGIIVSRCSTQFFVAIYRSISTPIPSDAVERFRQDVFVLMPECCIKEKWDMLEQRMCVRNRCKMRYPFLHALSFIYTKH